MKTLSRLWRGLWPTTCAVCARWPVPEAVCASCWQQYGTVLPRCPACAIALAPGLSRCHGCQSTGGPLQGCFARVDYRHPWTELVAQSKKDPAWARPMAQHLGEIPGLPDCLAHTDLMLPIPLTPDKLCQRGYNQAWALTQALRATLPRPPAAEPGYLQRHPDSATQHELGRAARWHNAERAYTLAHHAQTRVKGRRVLLVDDVMTTGATLQALAQRLHEAGAHSVHAVVFARTPSVFLDG